MKKANRLKKPMKRKMTDREAAYGWLVLGMGETIPEAAQIATAAPIRQIESWARKQRKALKGFAALIKKTIAESESSPAKPSQLGVEKPDAGRVKKYSALLRASGALVKAAKAIHPEAEPEIIETVCRAAVEEQLAAA